MSCGARAIRFVVEYPRFRYPPDLNLAPSVADALLVYSRHWLRDAEPAVLIPTAGRIITQPRSVSESAIVISFFSVVVQFSLSKKKKFKKSNFSVAVARKQLHVYFTTIFFFFFLSTFEEIKWYTCCLSSFIY